MIQGSLRIIRDLQVEGSQHLANEVQQDYANYFYPLIKDQLGLPVGKFLWLYRAYGRMGFFRYPMFHFYCVIAYLLGERKFDLTTKAIRRHLGRTPQFGAIK